MNISVIIILFKSRIIESSTIESLIKADINSLNLNLIIWNNGPELLSNNDVEYFRNICNDKNIHFEIYQDVRNISLSRIYNYFIYKKSYDFLTIFDQDSLLPHNFFYNILNHSSFDIIIPRVYDINNKSVQTYPKTHKGKVIQEGIFDIKNTKSIGSGITISNRMIVKTKESSNLLFDENFVLYYCDYSFFFGLNTDWTNSIRGCCRGYILHSESGGLRYDKMPEINKLELGYEYILHRLGRRKFLITNILACLNYKRKTKCSTKSLKKLLACAYFKRHPRGHFVIKLNMQPDYKN